MNAEAVTASGAAPARALGADEAASPVAPVPWRSARRWPTALGAGLVAAAAALAASALSGGIGLAGAGAALGGGLLAIAVVLASVRFGAATAQTGTSAAELFDNSASAAGSRLLAGQVVPVWQRQLEASRAEAEKGVGTLLESFNQLSTGLSNAVGAAGPSTTHLGAGAADDLVDRHQSLIDDLLQPVASLRQMRDEVQRELVRIAEVMHAFQRAGKDLDSLARHARLVAMNASIEANRAGQSQGGFGAVAREVLELSTNTGTSAQLLLQRFGEATRRLEALRSRFELDTSNDETLRLALRQRARALIVALVGNMSEALAGSRELRESSQQLQAALEEVFMGFQFQDRFTQMMGSVLTDMTRFVQWLAENKDATHADAVAWLARLDASYTMEQQRSHHHGTVEIKQGPTVEFF